MSQPGPQDGSPAAVTVLSYASPHGYEPGVWRSGKYVVVSRGAHLPPRCVVCNGTATTSLILHTGQPHWPLHVGLCGWHKFLWRVWRIVGILLTTFAFCCSVLVAAVLSVYGTEERISSLTIALLIGPALVAMSIIVFLPLLIINQFLKPLGHVGSKGDTLWLWRSGRAFRNSLRELDNEVEPIRNRGDP